MLSSCEKPFESYKRHSNRRSHYRGGFQFGGLRPATATSRLNSTNVPGFPVRTVFDHGLHTQHDSLPEQSLPLHYGSIDRSCKSGSATREFCEETVPPWLAPFAAIFCTCLLRSNALATGNACGHLRADSRMVSKPNLGIRLDGLLDPLDTDA